MVYLRTLGRLELHAGGPEGPILIRESRVLLLPAWLGITPSGTSRRDYVARLLWPEADLRRARKSLRQALYVLSKNGAGEAIRVDAQELSLDCTAFRADILEFEQAVVEGDPERILGYDNGRFLESVESALSRELADWADAVNQRMRIAIGRAYWRVVTDRIEGADAEGAIDLARRYAEANPLNDRAQTLLVRALKAAGDEPGAYLAYEKYRVLVERAAADVPSDELRVLVAGVKEELLRLADRGAAPIAPRPGAAATSAGPGTPIPRRRSWNRSHFIIAGAAIGVVALGAVFGVMPVGLAWGSGEEEASVVVSFAPEVDVPKELRIDGDRVSIRKKALSTDNRAVAGPDGRIAYVELASSGYDLALADSDGRNSRILVATEADEWPLSWSPDGRYILYGSGERPSGARSYERYLAVFDLAEGTGRKIFATGEESSVSAAWSPDGTRIASEARIDGQKEIVVMAPDGSGVRNVSDHPARDALPEWSPDGRRIAFVSERTGQRELFVVHPDGRDLRQVSFNHLAEGMPLWITRSTIVAAVEDGGRRSVWAFDWRTAEQRELTPRRAVAGVWQGLTVRTGLTPWLETVQIVSPSKGLSPGLRVRLGVRALDSRRSEIRMPDLPIRWSLADTTIARLDGDSMLLAVAEGSLVLAATVPGWRADTVALDVHSPRSREMDPLWCEDWKGGIRPDVWEMLGDPTPYTRPSGGPEGAGVFVSNGDANYLSGVRSRLPVSLEAGLTLEAWGKMPFTGEHYEDFTLHVLSSSAVEAAGEEWFESRVASLGINGRERAARLFLTGATVEVPFPDTPARWHRYTLQIEPDGTVTYGVDGRPLYREEHAVPVETLTEGWVGVAGNSLSTEILHGPVCVYGEPLYR